MTMPCELITFGKGKAGPKSDCEIPVYGGNGVLSYKNQYNAKILSSLVDFIHIEGRYYYNGCKYYRFY